MVKVTITSCFDEDGDGNGDDDVIVSAYGNDGGGTSAGEAYVYSTAQYAQRGRYISDTFSVDGVKSIKWISIDWRPFTQPEDTLVQFQIAMNNDSTTWDFVGPDGTEDTFFTNPHGQVLYSGQSGNFIKIRACLSTSIGSKTPTITEFTINYKQFDGPSVTLTSPNGGEDWMKEAYYPLTWNAKGSFNSTPICLYYTTDNGATWTTIAEWISDTGHYNWTVPNIDTPSALIKVTATDGYGETVSDVSDASFAIDPPPPAWSGGDAVDMENTPPVFEDEPGSAGEVPSGTGVEPDEDTGGDESGYQIGYGLLAMIMIPLAISLLVNLFFMARNKRSAVDGAEEGDSGGRPKGTAGSKGKKPPLIPNKYNNRKRAGD